MNPNLASLPVELQQHVASSLFTDDRLSLADTCWAFRSLLIGDRYETLSIRFEISDEGDLAAVQMLGDASELGNETAINYTEHVSLSITDTTGAGSLTELLDFSRTNFSRSAFPKTWEPIQAARARICELLRSLPKFNTFSLFMGDVCYKRCDEAWSYPIPIITDCLSLLPAVRYFDLTSGPLCTPLYLLDCLKALPQLERLKISDALGDGHQWNMQPAEDSTTALIESIGIALAGKPLLRELSINPSQFGGWDTKEVAPSIGHLFTGRALAASEPLLLTKLTIGPAQLSAKCKHMPQAVRHLRYLQDLTVFSDEHTSFWDALRENHIHLKNLKCQREGDSSCPALMAYLASYSGLEKLQLGYNNDLCEYNRSPRALSALLVAQRASLRELFAWGQIWNYTLPLGPALSGCMVLEVLRLSIDPVEALLKDVTSLPRLRSLELSGIGMRRGGWSRTAIRRSFNRTLKTELSAITAPGRSDLDVRIGRYMRARWEADEWVFSSTGFRGSESRDMGIDECVDDTGVFFQTEL